MLEDLGVRRRGEVPVLRAGRAVGAHDPVDELAQGPLACGAAERAPEVLARDDVRGVHRPEVGELHPALLEVDRAVAPVGHDDVPQLPGDLVIGMDARRGVDASHLQTGGPGGGLGAGSGGGLARFRATVVGHGAPRLASVGWCFSPAVCRVGVRGYDGDRSARPRRSAIAVSKSSSDSKDRYTEANRR